ncbi:glutamine amidotransferases class-II / queuosine biosynthesis ATPase [Bacillus phage BSTP8]|nr:putative QueC-like protein [Bacillus phage BSP19]AYJ76163.1 putative QueC-like protein [Bacillus phage BSP7]QQO90095.1 glutamine amidotransferases class-II / queuosine biosynthesis ATPase [Bacillus phage BSTP5]QRI44384.1 glutamine amidotransferases class-II / queuosine biosynthesis ATPase [Bacillus phage BSTP8]QRI44465.1 glutamine amidotransferases class-II / queuosine biosynthesis ATPase [Bacillus phage BSTP10]QRI44513.1 glutamine amidotransferases class-II / queuosine biosynthesis ATPase 
MSKALVLLSGGMDSCTCAAIAKENHDEVHALNVFYGQRHAVEIESAKQITKALELDSYTELDLSDTFKNFKSALVLNAGIEVDDNQDKNSVGATYVPARNSILLSAAAGFADSKGYDVVYYGAHAEDHNSYPDCRPEYFYAMKEALRLGTDRGVVIEAPFIELHKSDIAKIGTELNVPFGLTHSCYRGERPACGTCPTCVVRLEAFKEAGLVDPLNYATDLNA